MLFNSSRHLKALKKILQSKPKNSLFLCIKDLVKNGLTLSRFSGEQRRPSRQDITQFIAAWLKYIGVSPDECREWMIDYCLDKLSVISSSSRSQIRHSTKSNIKYIYRSDVPFDCGCENNVFKASCDRNCPVYDEMDKRYQERIAREANRTYEIIARPAKPTVILPPPSVKEQYKDQFDRALEVISNYLNQGIAKKDIVKRLNDGSIKTRTGKKWTYSVLHAELKRHSEIKALAKKPMKKSLAIKEQYQDQFEKALESIDNYVKQGIAKKEIVQLLNDREFKTRTGKKWTCPVLQNELKRLNNTK